MTREQLLERIAVKQSEDGFTERKRGVAEDDVVPTLVAFANSVPPDREAVLFLGLDRNGKVHGVQNADESQRKIGRWIGQCYPPIKVETTVLSIDGVEILAVVVRASDERPHFAGPAWVRERSETVKATQQVYAELIAGRNDVAREILRHKGQSIEVICIDCQLDGRALLPAVGTYDSYQCTVEGCTAHSVYVRDLSGKGHDIPISAITPQWNRGLSPPRLVLRLRAY